MIYQMKGPRWDDLSPSVSEMHHNIFQKKIHIKMDLISVMWVRVNVHLVPARLHVRECADGVRPRHCPLETVCANYADVSVVNLVAS